MPTGRRRAVAAALALGALALVAGVVWSGLQQTRRPAGTPGPQAAAGRTPDVASRPPAAPPGPPGAAPGPSEASEPWEAPEPSAPRGFGPDAPARAWAGVDMEAVRAALPGNLYWKLAMPTDDAAILREREEIRAHWNARYGKVLSNTASEAEVREYFAHRRRLSADYVEFATYLLDHYGDTIPERDVGLLELAREMHLARLEEIPRKLSEALARREAHEAARQQWLEEQARLAPAAGPDADAPPPR